MQLYHCSHAFWIMSLRLWRGMLNDTRPEVMYPTIVSTHSASASDPRVDTRSSANPALTSGGSMTGHRSIIAAERRGQNIVENVLNDYCQFLPMRSGHKVTQFDGIAAVDASQLVDRNGQQAHRLTVPPKVGASQTRNVATFNASYRRSHTPSPR